MYKSKNLKEIRSHFANYLKKKRLSSSLSQGDVARRLGYGSAQSISNIERGLCPVPFSVIRKMITLYEINEGEILRKFTDMQAQLFLSEIRSKKTSARA